MENEKDVSAWAKNDELIIKELERLIKDDLELYWFHNRIPEKAEKYQKRIQHHQEMLICLKKDF